MPAKAKPKTGAALDQQSEMAPDINAPVNQDGSAPGFNATPAAPSPSGPSFGMGGDVTQPSDFSKEVAEATNVPSKGGPPVEDLYASSGKGPVGKLKRPQDTTSTTKAPEEKAPPVLASAIGEMAPDINAPVAGAPAPAPAAAAPATTPTPAPSTQPTAAAPATQAPATTAQPADQGLPPGDPRALPAFQDHNDTIQQFARQYWRGDQNVSRLDPYIANDPDYAGMVNGVPFFMGADRRPYFRDETGPGKETRHYADSPAGSKEATDGVQVTNEDKQAASRDAQQRMTALLQTRDAIDAWQKQFDQYKAAHGEENPWQQTALQTVMSGATDPWSTVGKFSAGLIGGLNEDMKKLDIARAQATSSYGQSWTKNLPTVQGTREALATPNTTDSFATQQAKVDAMREAMAREARALSVLYPHGNRQVEKILKSIGQSAPGQGGQPSGGQSTTSSSAAQAPDFSDDSPASKAAYAKLPKGQPFRYKGQLSYKQ